MFESRPATFETPCRTLSLTSSRSGVASPAPAPPRPEKQYRGNLEFSLCFMKTYLVIEAYPQGTFDHSNTRLVQYSDPHYNSLYNRFFILMLTACNFISVEILCRRNRRRALETRQVGVRPVLKKIKQIKDTVGISIENIEIANLFE